MTQPAPPQQPPDLQIDVSLYIANLEDQRNEALSAAARWKAAYDQANRNAQEVIGRLQARVVELTSSDGNGGEPAAGG